MVRKTTFYGAMTGAWWLVVIATGLAVLLGEARPYVSPATIPYGGPGALGIMIALVLAGTFVIGRLQARAWKQMGRAVGLEPEGRSLRGEPAMTGTVDGRTVRAFTYTVQKGSSAEGGGSSVTYTVVEAELRTDEADGYIIGRGEGTPVAGEAVPDELRQKSLDGHYYLVGEASADYGNQVLTGRVRTALDDLTGAGGVIVGDPTDAIMAAVPDDLGGTLGSMMVSKIRERISDRRAFKAGTASHSDEGLLLDADELAARIEAVVAVAEAHETATRKTTAE